MRLVEACGRLIRLDCRRDERLCIMVRTELFGVWAFLSILVYTFMVFTSFCRS